MRKWNWGILLRVSSIAVGVVATSGCERDVIRDTAGAGSGGSSGSNGSASGKSSSSTVKPEPTSSAASGPDPNVCDKFCSVAGGCFANCQATCASYLADPCALEGNEYVQCLTANLNPQTCQAYECDPNPLLECRSTVPQECGGAGCVGSSTVCSCTRECDGGEQRAICNFQDGNATCTCYLNTLSVATCQAPLEEGGCDLEKGCCSFYFGSQPKE